MNKSYRNQKNVLYKIPGSSVNDSYNEQLSYDKNGNILTLKRNGEDETEFYTFMIDDLDYDYDGNQLRNVTDTSGALQGFNDGNKHTQTKKNDFEYDDYGNMVIDRNKGITNITYNHLNLPKKIMFGNNQSIEYLYAADGSKLKKTVTDGATNKTVDYLGGFQYEDEILSFFPHAEGYIKVVTGNISGYSYHYVYNYTDHLGNIRLRYTKHPLTGEIERLEENHYYPFGLEHQGYQPHHKIIGFEGPGSNVAIIPTSTNVGDPYKYKFGGKEYQEEFDVNVYDFGARNYDAALGRWMNVDPLAEEMRRHSPYNYAFNNPIFFIDPDGMAPRMPPIGSLASYGFKDFSDSFAEVERREESERSESSETSNTGQTAECDDCAKGGHFNGRELRDLLGIKDNSTIFNKMRTEGYLLDKEELDRHLLKYESHIEEIGKLLEKVSDGGFSVSTIAFLLKKRTAAGLITNLFVKIQSSNIPEDQKELLKVSLRYAEMHSDDILKGQGVYMIKERSGSLWLPGSDKVILNYYDKATGKYLGGIGRSFFGTVKQEKYKKD